RRAGKELCIQEALLARVLRELVEDEGERSTEAPAAHAVRCHRHRAYEAQPVAELVKDHAHQVVLVIWRGIVRAEVPVAEDTAEVGFDVRPARRQILLGYPVGKRDGIPGLGLGCPLEIMLVVSGSSAAENARPKRGPVRVDADGNRAL